jgi:4-hydroxy-3-polyprenylbenzoate decarboxylase
MVYQNLRDFLRFLDRTGQLVRIRGPVSVDLEMAEITDRTMKLPGGGPALLFERPVLMDGTESPIPVAINIFGSWRRMAAALGVDDVEVHARRIAELVKPEIPKGLWGKMAMLPKLAELTKVPPRPYKGAPPCQQVILREGEFDLTRFPVLKTWPDDGGPFITLPMVVTCDPETGIQNIGMYRMQVFGPNSTGMHWQRHKGGAAHYRAWKRERGGRMPVVVAIGGDPATMYTPSAPLPPGIDEYLFGGFLRRDPVRTCKALTADLTIPAEAEIVLEGVRGHRRGAQDRGAVRRPHRLLHAGRAVSHLPRDHGHHALGAHLPRHAGGAAAGGGRVPGRRHGADLPSARAADDAGDRGLPHAPEGVFHNLVFVSIRKEYPGHAYKVMNGLWGMGLMSLAKVIVVVDEGIDVRNTQEAWWYALGNIDPERDVSSPGAGGRPGPRGAEPVVREQDGDRRDAEVGEEGFTRRWPEMIEMDAGGEGARRWDLGAARHRADRLTQLLWIVMFPNCRLTRSRGDTEERQGKGFSVRLRVSV